MEGQVCLNRVSMGKLAFLGRVMALFSEGIHRQGGGYPGLSHSSFILALSNA
jgi:hypothetical protein